MKLIVVTAAVFVPLYLLAALSPAAGQLPPPPALEECMECQNLCFPPPQGGACEQMTICLDLVPGGATTCWEIGNGCALIGACSKQPQESEVTNKPATAKGDPAPSICYQQSDLEGRGKFIETLSSRDSS